MKKIHQKIHLNTGDTVVIDSSHQCCAFLLCDADCALYLSGHTFTHSGYTGAIQPTPVQLYAPSTEMWNVLIMFDDDNSGIKYSMSVK